MLARPCCPALPKPGFCTSPAGVPALARGTTEGAGWDSSPSSPAAASWLGSSTGAPARGDSGHGEGQRGRDRSQEEGRTEMPAPALRTSTAARPWREGKGQTAAGKETGCLGKFPLYFLIYFCKRQRAQPSCAWGRAMRLDAGGSGERKAPRQRYSCPPPRGQGWSGGVSAPPSPGALHTAWAPREHSLPRTLPHPHTHVLDFTLNEAPRSLRLVPPPLPPVTCTLLPPFPLPGLQI